MKEIENGLIPVYEDEKGNQLVDGRRLHDFLKVRQDFSDWIKSQLKSVGAIENKDYSLSPFKKEQVSGAKYLIEYTLTIQIAEEICMVAGIAPRANKETKRLSKQARQYFIFVEEKCRKQHKELQEQKYKQLESKVNAVEIELKELKETRVIDYGKQQSLTNICKSKVVSILGGMDSPAYKNKHIRSKTFSSIWSAYKNKFEVNSYKNTAVKNLESGIDFLTRWQPPEELKEQIQITNSQMRLFN